MEIEIQITTRPILPNDRWRETFSRQCGAFAEFSGIVRDLEDDEKISALKYEAYSPMAENEMRRILEFLAQKHPCRAARVVHRIGVIPVGATAIYVGIVSRHRGEAFAVLTEFMNRLKQDVPIWKARSLVEIEMEHKFEDPKGLVRQPPDSTKTSFKSTSLALEDAQNKISNRCQPLSGIRVSLADAAGHILLEDVCADEDSPSCDRSTRDGFAIRTDDTSEVFTVVDTLHAADWKPRELISGEAVRVATGASLPCKNLRVVMQENVERSGNQIKVTHHESTLNIRERGEEMKAGQNILPAGRKLDAGNLALLAAVGHTHPLVNRTLRVMHFTTGDEIVSPAQTPQPGQIRDCNSILIRALLQRFPCEIIQQHLPEDFELAKATLGNPQSITEGADVILVSGGASVGEKDFTRPLLEWLGFEIVFNRTNIRPGAPLIFGVDDGVNALKDQSDCRVAFGLPGNPLSHFVCFHLFVATALAGLTGAEPPRFLIGTLAVKLEDAPNPRETLCPAHWLTRNGKLELTPLDWSSSGDVVAMAGANALIRVPPNQGTLPENVSVEFLPTDC